MKTYEINTQKSNSAYGEKYPQTRRVATVTTDSVLKSLADHAKCSTDDIVTSLVSEDGKHRFGYVRGTDLTWGADLVTT